MKMASVRFLTALVMCILAVRVADGTKKDETHMRFYADLFEHCDNGIFTCRSHTGETKCLKREDFCDSVFQCTWGPLKGFDEIREVCNILNNIDMMMTMAGVDM